MTLVNRFVLPGIFRMNFLEISKAIVSSNRTIKSHHHFTNLSSWKKKSPNPGDSKRFCTQVISSLDENTFNHVQKNSNNEESDMAKMFEEIADGDLETLKKLKVLAFEMAVLREQELRVPDRMNKKQWLELLKLGSMMRRRKYLAFLRLNELKSQSLVEKSALERELYEKQKEELGFHFYGLSGHTMFMRIYEKRLLRLLSHRIWKPKLNIIMDCSYQDYMTPINVKNCAKQISFCLTQMKLHRYPCNIKFCNFQKEDALGQVISNYYVQFYESPLVEYYSESYLNLFPKERLVYLSPDAKYQLSTINHNDVYIIGAYVDKGVSEKMSLAKAKENKLRTAKFPIDEYLFWKKGTKSLPLNIVLNVLLDMAFYNDWNKAFKNIPQRCLTE